MPSPPSAEREPSPPSPAPELGARQRLLLGLRRGPWLGAVLFAGTLLLLCTRFAVPVANKHQRDYVRAGYVILALIASWLLVHAGRFAVELRRERGVGGVAHPAPHPERAARLLIRDRLGLFLGLWVFFTVPLLLWFVGEWPGHLRSDQAQSVRVALELMPEPWLSTLWGLYSGAVQRVSGHFTTLLLLDIGLLGWVLADVFSLMLAQGLSRRVAAVFILLLATSIPVGTLSIYLSHDVLTSYLKLGIITVVFRMLVRSALLGGRPASTPHAVALLCVLTLTTSLLRGENLALFLYLPLLLWRTRQVRPLVAVTMLGALLCGNLVFRKAVEPRVIEPLTKSGDFNHRYSLSLLLNPLGFLVTNHYFSPTPEEDQRAISDVVDWQCISSSPDVYEPPCYWSGLHLPITDERMAAVRHVYLKAVLNNPALFLANRLIVFSGQLGLNGKPVYPLYFQREQYTDAQLQGAFAPLLEEQGLRFEREHPSALQRLTHALRDWSSPYRGIVSPGYWIWNGVPALVLLLLLAATWRKNPISAALAGVLLCPLVLFVGAAPASHVSYVTDLWVFGYLAIPLVVFERTALKARRAAPGA